MINQKRHQQLSAAEPAAFIHGRDAIAVPIEHQADGRGS